MKDLKINAFFFLFNSLYVNIDDLDRFFILVLVASSSWCGSWSNEHPLMLFPTVQKLWSLDKGL